MSWWNHHVQEETGHTRQLLVAETQHLALRQPHERTCEEAEQDREGEGDDDSKDVRRVCVRRLASKPTQLRGSERARTGPTEQGRDQCLPKPVLGSALRTSIEAVCFYRASPAKQAAFVDISGLRGKGEQGREGQGQEGMGSAPFQYTDKVLSAVQGPHRRPRLGRSDMFASTDRSRRTLLAQRLRRDEGFSGDGRPRSSCGA